MRDGDFGDCGDVDTFWEIFESGTDLEFDGRVDVVDVFHPVVETHETPGSGRSFWDLVGPAGVERGEG